MTFLGMCVGPLVDDRALADLPLDDIGNMQRLLARCGGDLAMTPGVGPFSFDGARWVEDAQSAQAMKAAQRTARAVQSEIKALESELRGLIGDDDSELKRRLTTKLAAHRKWATTSANAARLAAMLNQAWPHLVVPLAGWNADPFKLCVQNGTLDLSFEKPVLCAHQRSDRITRIANAPYHEDAIAPLFEAFISRVLPDPEVRAFVRRLFGASLIDSSSDQAIILFHGAGANGKSTLLNSAAYVMGDYAVTVAPESLLHSERSGSEASPDIARLATRPRLVRVSEPESGARISVSAVKALTGGEPVVARQLRQAPIEFVPSFKIIISLNNRPMIRDGTDGIWRRIVLVSWDVQIPSEDRDLDLSQKLRTEGSGILNWMLVGLADYKKRGLAPPPTVLADVQGYRADADPFNRFYLECCVQEEGAEVDASTLYRAYKTWIERESLGEPMSVARVGRRLSDSNVKRRKSGKQTFRVGLRLTDEARAELLEG